ncbi:unnamed protein product, partial [Heterotrigona itama]
MIDGFAKTRRDNRISNASGRITLLALHRNPRATPNAQEKSDAAPLADIFPAKYSTRRMQYSTEKGSDVFHSNS